MESWTVPSDDESRLSRASIAAAKLNAGRSFLMRALDGKPAPITSVWPRLRHLSRVRRQNASVASDQRGTMNSGKIRTRAGDSAAFC